MRRAFCFYLTLFYPSIQHVVPSERILGSNLFSCYLNISKSSSSRFVALTFSVRVWKCISMRFYNDYLALVKILGQQNVIPFKLLRRIYVYGRLDILRWLLIYLFTICKAKQGKDILIQMQFLIQCEASIFDGILATFQHQELLIHVLHDQCLHLERKLMLPFLKSEVAESSSKKIAQVDMQSTDLQSQSSHNKMEIRKPAKHRPLSSQTSRRYPDEEWGLSFKVPASTCWPIFPLEIRLYVTWQYSTPICRRWKLVNAVLEENHRS